MDIRIKNCFNIKEGNIKVANRKLNLFYGMNGTGKSTIGNSLDLKVSSGDLTTLKPFGSQLIPEVNIPDEISSILIFNEKFVNDIVFKESEVIDNAFEVFLKTENYEECKLRVKKKISKIKIDTDSNEIVRYLLAAGQTILSKISLNKDKTLKKVGMIKSIATTESIYKLPKELTHFSPFMKKEYKADWVGWKTDGANFDDNSICPFCAEGLSQEYESEKQLFTASYTKSNVKNINELISYIEGIDQFLVKDKRNILLKALKEENDFNLTNLWLSKLYIELYYLISKIREILDFNSFTIKSSEISNIDDKLKKLFISSDSLDILKSDIVLSEMDNINSTITAILKETDELKKEIGQLKNIIGSTSKKVMKDINDFLEIAGINYSLQILQDDEYKAKSILVFKTLKEEIQLSNIRAHLSWGERNAFALVLFLHYALYKKPNLIILDDPISSFDSNKKYAILNRLFYQKTNKESLFQKTVLMMTHDLQPMIDFIVNEMPCTNSVIGHYLLNNEGILISTQIEKKDISSLPLLLLNNSKNEEINIIHRIISLRKYIEHTVENLDIDIAYNLLSGLIHGNENPSDKDENEFEEEIIKQGELIINNYITGFNYSSFYNNYFTTNALINLYKNEVNSYYKLQIFRIILIVFDLKKHIDDDSLIKYIDEQFHVENDYIFSLNLNKFDTVPSFIIPKCNEFLMQKGVIIE